MGKEERIWQEKGVESTTLFEMSLGLTGGRKVVKASSGGTSEAGDLLGFREWQPVECLQCGEKSAVHDMVEKRWRHLNLFQYECELVPRMKCEKHGVRQVSVPWAKPGSGFTLTSEAALMVLARERPVSAVAEMLGEMDTRLWRLIISQVEEPHRQSDWNKVKAIAIDETSVRKGWNYVTVIIDEKTQC